MAENYNAQDMCMDWNDSIENDGREFTPLPEGDYVYKVVGFERARHAGSANLPPCNKASLTLQVYGEDGKTSRVFCDLFLYRTMEWKMSAFFRSIGQKKHGEKFTPNWNKVLNERGRAHFKFVEYKDRNGDDRIKNEVDRFLDYDASLMPPDTDTASSAEVDEDGFMKIPDGIADELPFD